MALRIAGDNEGDEWDVNGPGSFDVVRVVEDAADGKTRLVALFVCAPGDPAAEINAQKLIRGADLVEAHAPIASRRRRA